MLYAIFDLILLKKKECMPIESASESQLEQIAKFLGKEVEDLTDREVDDVAGQATQEEQEQQQKGG